ncbi:MAG: glycosyltransferase family 2 protein, partial [Candidatus Thermoplasmatota archaeon]|nr:glycosyltransferase family 2 protein [Candidatus Thermoplasmatota archaeon]
MNWNGAALLPDCLNSLAKQTYQNYTVVVTDNGSTDASIDIINKYDRYVLVQLSENKGFAGGNNAGYEHIKKSIPSKYIVLLNNDTKVDNKWLEELVNCAEQHEDAGSIVSKVRFFDKPNHLHHTGILLYPDLTTTNRGMYEEDKGQYNKFEEVFGGIGCSVIIRVEALGPDALFEDRFFAYREDDEV